MQKKKWLGKSLFARFSYDTLTRRTPGMDLKYTPFSSMHWYIKNEQKNLTIGPFYITIGAYIGIKIKIPWLVLFEGRYISLYKNGPIWADAVGGNYAVSQKGPKVRFGSLCQNVVLGAHWTWQVSKLLGLFFCINACWQDVWTKV